MPERSTLRDCYDTVINFANPRSSGFKRARTRLQMLKDDERVHRFDVRNHLTGKSFTENCEIVERAVGDQQTALIGIAGGDGSFNYMQRVLEELGIKNPTVQYGGGSACDLALSLSDSYGLKHPTSLLRRGRVASMSALEVTKTSGDNVERRKAYAHTGVGDTGRMSAWMNNDKVRAFPLQKYDAAHAVIEGGIILAAMAVSQVFEAYIDDDPEMTPVYDWFVTNAERMGKILRPQSHALENDARIIHIAEKHLSTLAASTGRLVLGKEPGELLGDGARLTISDSLPQRLYGHVDGEHFDVLGGDILEVAYASETVDVVTVF